MTLAYSVLQSLNSIGTDLFYEVVEKKGAVEIPDGPVIWMANHSYHMQDSVIMNKIIGRPDIYFVAYSTLYKGSFLGFIYSRLPAGPLRDSLERAEDGLRYGAMRTMHMIPIHRAADGKSDFASKKQNFSFLDEAAKRVAEGHVVIIYPDGGSPDGFAFGEVKAGAAQLAIRAAELAAEAGKTATLVCSGTIHGAFHEPLHSPVTVSIADPIALQPWFERSKKNMRSARRDLVRLIDKTIRDHMIVAEVNDVKRIEQLSELYRGVEPDHTRRVRVAVEIVAQLTKGNKEALNGIGAKLDRYGEQARRNGLLPGMEQAETKVVPADLALAPLVYLGVALHAVPLTIVWNMTKQFPSFLFLRGQQMFGTSVSIFTLWYGILGVLGIESALSGELPALPVATALTLNGVLGALAARRFWRTNLALFRFMKLPFLAQHEAFGREIIDEVAHSLPEGAVPEAVGEH